MVQIVDFVILRDRRPWIAIEAKLSGTEIAPALRYFVERAHPAYAFQVVRETAGERRHKDIGRTEVRTLSAARLLANLP